MTKDEALKLALRALRFAHDDGYENEVSHDAITAIKQALAAPVQEPSGSFMTREQAIEFCRRCRPGIEPTEQHITATIDAYAALFGDLAPAAPVQEENLYDLAKQADNGGQP